MRIWQCTTSWRGLTNVVDGRGGKHLKSQGHHPKVNVIGQGHLKDTFFGLRSVRGFRIVQNGAEILCKWTCITNTIVIGPKYQKFIKNHTSQ